MARSSRPKPAQPTDDHERQLLGERLRVMRVRRRLSLGDVALGTGLSRSFVALLESGQTDVSVSRLLRLAEFYGVWISDLVGSIGPAVEIVAAEDVTPFPADDPGVFLALLTKQPVRGLLPFKVELAPGSRLEGGVAHSGEEFVYCTRGEVELQIVEAVYHLREGHAASYPGRLPHAYANAGKGVAVLIGATTRT